MMGRIRRGAWLLLAPLLLSALAVNLACTTGNGGATTTGPGAPTPVLVGVNLEGFPGKDDLHRVASQTGLTPDLVGFYLQWPSDPAMAPPAALASTVSEIAGTGALPLLTWEPMAVVTGSETMIPAAEIISGRWDPYLRAVGRVLAGTGQPLLVRFGHEMNLARYHWGGPRESFNASSPALYRGMFRHVAETVIAAGATSTLWVFCPNVEPVPAASGPAFAWNVMASWFPGADIVDIAGLDGYNWGDTRTLADHGWESRWRTFPEIFAPALAELRTVVGSMPVLVCETASTRSGGDRAAWVAGAAQSLETMGLAGIVWFHVDKELDWSLVASEGRLLSRSREGQDGRARAWAVRLIEERSGRH